MPVATRFRPRLPWVVPALAAMAAVPLAGCVSIGTTPKPQTMLFSQDAPDLRPLPRNRAWLGYRAPDYDAARYHAVIIEAVVLAPEVAQRLPEKARAELSAALRAELGTALAPLVPASTPGPGVLVVRVAITAIGKPSKALNAAALPTGLMGIPLPVMSSGGAAIEADVADAMTGRRVAALRARAKGAKGPLGSLRDFDHARNALRRLAQALGRLVSAG